MKKYLLLGLLPAFLLLGCKDDEKPVTPMNSLERVTCYKNNSPWPESEIRIIYNNEGKLSQLEEYNSTSGLMLQYTYIVNTSSINVSLVDYSAGAPAFFPNYRTLDLAGSRVYKERFNDTYEHNGSKETYAKVRFDYVYNSSSLGSINRTTVFPDDGQYNERELKNAVTFQYLYGNLSKLSWSADINTLVKMEIAYSDTPIPTNFPLRFLRPINLDAWDMLDPLNFYYGAGSLKLPSSIKVTDLASGEVTEYTFTPHTLNDGYLMDMEIRRLRNSIEDVYTYAFKYKGLQ